MRSVCSSRCPRACGVLFAWALTGALAWATPGVSAPKWTYHSTTNDIMVYTRARAGSDVAEVKAVGALPQTPARLFAAVHDVENFDKFFPFTDVSRVVRVDGKRKLIYQLVDPPFLSARDYYVWISDDSTGLPAKRTYRSTWTAAKAYVKKSVKPDVVRLADLAGQWTIRAHPKKPGHSQVTYWVHTDPGGAIPAFVLNAGNTRAVPKFFDAILERSQRPEYAPKAEPAPSGQTQAP